MIILCDDINSCNHNHVVQLLNLGRTGHGRNFDSKNSVSYQAYQSNLVLLFCRQTQLFFRHLRSSLPTHQLPSLVGLWVTQQEVRLQHLKLPGQFQSPHSVSFQYSLLLSFGKHVEQKRQLQELLIKESDMVIS